MTEATNPRRRVPIVEDEYLMASDRAAAFAAAGADVSPSPTAPTPFRKDSPGFAGWQNPIDASAVVRAVFADSNPYPSQIGNDFPTMSERSACL